MIVFCILYLNIFTSGLFYQIFLYFDGLEILLSLHFSTLWLYDTVLTNHALNNFKIKDGIKGTAC